MSGVEGKQLEKVIRKLSSRVDCNEWYIVREEIIEALEQAFELGFRVGKMERKK